MLDIPAALGVDHLVSHQTVGPEELQAACGRQLTELKPGDTVLIRTGAMRNWPDEASLSAADGSGLSLDGAKWLQAQEVGAVGADNSGLEVSPTTIPGDPLPVHRFLIQERGVPILEWVHLEALARDSVYQFLFICLPLTVRGATGSMVRPLAII
jgi:kynurenine formamidase